MQPHIKSSKYLVLLIISLYITVVSGTNDTCGCYMLGTLGSIEGESMCANKTLQCKCYPNIIGKNCDQCANGFYNILSGRGCSSCRCSPLGSINKSCNFRTGQCQCKTGFTGFRCDRCEPNTYKFSSGKCLNCNCNPYGSTDLQCNIVGQCPCLPNAEGHLCDHCKENTYNIKRGCIPCPPCYEFIQSAIKNYTKYLNTIQEIIEETENNLPLLIQDYKHFLNEIKLLKAKIYKLQLEYEDADKTVLSEEWISKLTKEAEDFHNEVLKLIKQLDNDLHKKEIKNALYVGRTNLKEANDLVKLCEAALENATKTAKSLNRHNKTMTLFAKNSIETSQKIEEEAEELQQLSLAVNSSCTEACNTADQFLKKQQTFTTDLENIQNNILNSTNGAETMKTYLQGFHEETKIAKEKSLQLNEEANSLLIPNSEKLSSDLKDINNNLTSINEAIKNITEESNKIKEKEKSTDNYIKNVENKQKNIDDKLSLATSYEERANAAINESNNVFESAQKSLKNLEKFKEIKDAAEAALINMPEIRAKVDAVLNNSDEIENIFHELSVVIKEMDKMQFNLSEILKMDKNNKAEVSKNFNILEELEQEDMQISQNLAEFHSKLKDIKRNLKNFEKYQLDIERDIKRMQEYILVLNTLPTTEKQLNEVEEEIKKMEDMVEAIQYLMNEKKSLQKEMKNIKDIIESIPIDDSTLCESAKSEPKTSEG